MKTLLKKLLRSRGQGQRGFTLIESLIGLGITGFIGAGLLSGLTGGLKAVTIADEQVTAQNVAQAQVEATKAAPYQIAPTTYPTTVSTPQGFSVAVTASPVADGDSSIQQITVTVLQDGQPVMTLESYKVNR